MDIVPQLVANSIIAGATYALVAVGFSLGFSATRFFNFTHGVLAAVAAYAVFVLGSGLGLHWGLAIPCGILFAGLVGWLLDIGVYRPLRKRRATNMVLLVASLGAFTAIQALIAMLFTSQFRTLARNIGTQKLYTVGTAVITQTQVIIVLVGIAVTVGLAFSLKKTLFGKMVRAISDDEEVSKIVGINTNRIIGVVFFISSAIAGLAGILVGYDTGIEPTMGMHLLLKGVVGAIVGGVGSIWGALLGSFLLGFAENFGTWQISGAWKSAIAFGLLIVFLIFRPQGILRS